MRVSRERALAPLLTLLLAPLVAFFALPAALAAAGSEQQPRSTPRSTSADRAPRAGSPAEPERALEAALAEEVERLLAPLHARWPELIGGFAEKEASPLARREGRARPAPPRLVGWAVAGSSSDELEARIAALVAERYWRAIESRLPPVPAFEDGSSPAPAAWVARAEPGWRRGEAKALAEALDAKTPEERASAATRFLELRYRRIAALDAWRVERLRREEQAQGLAAWVAYHALEQARGEEPGPALHALRPDFAYALAPRMRLALIDELRRAAAGEREASPEQSGAAIALLLDELRPTWPLERADALHALDALLARPRRPFGSN